MANARIFGIIISIFGHWQEPSLIILLEIDKSSEIGYYGTDLPFGLAVSLRMEGGEKPTLNAKEVVKWWPEFQSEKKASISKNWVQKTVVTHYHIYYNLCKPEYINGDLDRFVIDHLCEPINND